MHGSTVVLTALLTSVLTTVGTMYFIEKYDILHKDAPPDTVVPDFRGLPESDARANAAAAHIAVLMGAHEQSADVKAGSVIRQSTPPGQHVARDYPVTITLADEMTRVPGVEGLATSDAKQKLDDRGYTSEVAMTPSDTVNQGIVLEQVPKANVVLAKGGTVRLQVSSGPDVIEVPKLIGTSIPEAQKALDQLKLKAVVRWISMGETPTYVVLNQKPAPAEKVKPGTEVQLTACR
jgi:eukaryotic-like serine/threonine-protein kinase